MTGGSDCLIKPTSWSFFVAVHTDEYYIRVEWVCKTGCQSQSKLKQCSQRYCTSL
jgi:hypothetical protein